MVEKKVQGFYLLAAKLKARVGWPKLEPRKNFRSVRD